MHPPQPCLYPRLLRNLRPHTPRVLPPHAPCIPLPLYLSFQVPKLSFCGFCKSTLFLGSWLDFVWGRTDLQKLLGGPGSKALDSRLGGTCCVRLRPSWCEWKRCDAGTKLRAMQHDREAEWSGCPGTTLAFNAGNAFRLPLAGNGSLQEPRAGAHRPAGACPFRRSTPSRRSEGSSFERRSTRSLAAHAKHSLHCVVQLELPCLFCRGVLVLRLLPWFQAKTYGHALDTCHTASSKDLVGTFERLPECGCPCHVLGSNEAALLINHKDLRVDFSAILPCFLRCLKRPSEALAPRQRRRASRTAGHRSASAAGPLFGKDAQACEKRLLRCRIRRRQFRCRTA